MKKFKLLALIGLILVSSCTSYKQVPYLQNSREIDTTIVTELYDARIQPKDMLTITVSSENHEAAIPFNLTVATTASANTRSTYSQPVLQTYLVDNDGYIEFPTIGQLHISGLTKTETESLIKSKIKSHFSSDPIVNVRFTNYKISVLGEVARPNTYTISNEKVNLFEALAMAGDLTIDGNRDITLIREKNGQREVARLDLRDKDIINSPYYYLQQNDVIYVTPSERKINTRSEEMQTLGFAMSGVGLLAAIIALCSI